MKGKIDISGLFIADRNRKRVEKELAMVQHLPIRARALHGGLGLEYAKGDGLVFLIVLAEDYPFSVPQVLWTQEVMPDWLFGPAVNPLEVSLNDHRNLLFDILKSRWGPAVLLDNVISSIDSFVSDLKKISKE
jgi:hypothetical protein